MRILKRPGIRFIASLPTLCVDETTYKNMVLWKVEPNKPVVILYDNYPEVRTFWVEIITQSSWVEGNGWQYEMLVGIKKTKMGGTYIIPPRDEGFYSKIKWWNWAVK